MAMATRFVLLCLIFAMYFLSGCTRNHYRRRADTDAKTILNEKTNQTPWTAPSDYSIYPKSASRLYDESSLEDPSLPNPSPQLYSYALPDLPERDPDRFKSTESESFEFPALPKATHNLRRLPAVTQSYAPPSRAKTVSFIASAETAASPQAVQGSLDTPSVAQASNPDSKQPQLVPPPPESAATSNRVSQTTTTIRRLEIPSSYWNALPPSCLRRILEFDSIRTQYEQTFGRAPTDDQLNQSPRLTLEDIIDLTRLNQREYQSQKESLYLGALALDQQRFQQQLKLSAGGNRSSANFSHSRSSGDTNSGMTIPSQLGVDKMLVTGADLAARFANQVLITFNGTQGLSADVSSSLLFDFSQSLLQRDVQLESLTQAERNIVYTARSFTRYRKNMFASQTQTYYSLVQQFRRIEIQTQNYFNLIRNFNQREAEYRTLGSSSRTDVDQIEQQVLNGQSNLISACNGLERALDALKLSIGLPIEQQINLDLTELRLLTARDELAVTGDSMRRIRRRLESARQSGSPTVEELVSPALVLIERVFDFTDIQEQTGLQPPDLATLTLLQAQLQIVEARLLSQFSIERLNQELEVVPPSIPNLFQRRMEVIEEQLKLLKHQIELLRITATDVATIPQHQEQHRSLEARWDELTKGFQDLISEAQLERLEPLLAEAAKVQSTVATQVTTFDQLAQLDASLLNPEQRLQRTLQQTDYLLDASSSLLSISGSGLSPLEINVDDAMLTALTQRYDVMNQREQLADTWRQIKFRGDELRSILNLQASQVIRTRPDVNNPFDFTIDEASTSLGVTFDAPLNRRAQRNSYRQSLINYQRALRNLTQVEDNVKFSVRNDLRAIDLGKQTYAISVASAALAKDRVTATELQLSLGVQNIRARDFLESQASYTSALNNVAAQHIDFILARMQLFLDLELLTVDNNDFWHELYDESVQPQPQLDPPLPDEPAYGRLTPHMKHSKRIRRMLEVPRGTPQITSPELPESAPAASEATAPD